jgi:thioredoxin-like negative regulator of GroEL
MQAAQTSKKPLLVEFYSDSCLSCRALAPALHAVYNTQLKPCLHLVMVNMDNPVNADIAQIFKVETIPALFVFDPQRMKNESVALDTVQSEVQLISAVQRAQQTVSPAGCRLPQQAV